MKKQITTDKNGHQKTQIQVPVFAMTDNDALKGHQTNAKIDTMEEKVSFFDVKDLYDRAYAALSSAPDDYQTKEIMSEAIKLDVLYRCQLAQGESYRKNSRTHGLCLIQDARAQG